MNKSALVARILDIEWGDFEAKEAATDIPKSCWEAVAAIILLIKEEDTCKSFTLCKYLGIERN